MADYVLSSFASYEDQGLKEMIERGVKSIQMFLGNNPARALQQINSIK
jgi:peptidyl-tRNA hydrolase